MCVLVDFSLGSLMTSFSIQAVLFRMAVGGSIGAIDAALAGASVESGALQGAVIGALGPLIPGKVLFFLGVYGIFDALRNGQYAAAGFRIALLGFGTFAQTKGFKSCGKFKQVFGKAGEGKAWHHIVEQSQESRFGSDMIHNPQNIASVDEGVGLIHRKISGFYGSKLAKITGSDTMTVREWLSTKSFEEQYQFGLETMEQFGGGARINMFGLTNSWAWPSVLSPFQDAPEGEGDD